MTTLHSCLVTEANAACLFILTFKVVHVISTQTQILPVVGDGNPFKGIYA